MKTPPRHDADSPARLCVAVTECESEVTPKHVECRIGKNISFDEGVLQSYFFKGWDARLYDALLVGAVVEYCDRTRRRGDLSWKRDFQVSIPVHEPDHWRSSPVSSALLRALTFLTGDSWKIEFIGRSRRAQLKEQSLLAFPSGAEGILPFSEGMDSRAVAGILQRKLGDALVRVRLGSSEQTRGMSKGLPCPFAATPFNVTGSKNQFRETSGRSRGFKFSTLCLVASFLAGTKRIFVSESGQGSLGPALATVGQAHPDFRTHPRFLRMMEDYSEALLGWRPRHEFPQLWSTKGETLIEFTKGDTGLASELTKTRSCWQKARQVGFKNRLPHCGVCAACFLRRMSLNAAGIEELPGQYLWRNLSASRFEEGCDPEFPKKKITKAMREYAIAGVLHMEHLRELSVIGLADSALDRESFFLARELSLTYEDVRARLGRLFSQHSDEWLGFLSSVGSESFIHDWTRPTK